MPQAVRRAILEVVLCTLFYALFSLVALTIAAVFVRAYVPTAGVITAVNWVIKCTGSFLVPLLVLRGGRALVKGIASGVCGTLVTMLLFAAVGGGFSLSALFLAELAVCAVLGGLGALTGRKLRKE